MTMTVKNPGEGFVDWLRGQAGRGDFVGDLASDMVSDRRFDGTTASDLDERLLWANACAEAREGLVEGFSEYSLLTSTGLDARVALAQSLLQEGPDEAVEEALDLLATVAVADWLELGADPFMANVMAGSLVVGLVRSVVLGLNRQGVCSAEACWNQFESEMGGTRLADAQIMLKQASEDAGLEKHAVSRGWAPLLALAGHDASWDSVMDAVSNRSTMDLLMGSRP